MYNDHLLPNSYSLPLNGHSPTLFTLALTCPYHSFTLLVIIPSYSLTLMVTCLSHSLFLSLAHLIHAILLSLAHLIHPLCHLPILFTLLFTCPSYSLTLIVTCPSHSLFLSLAHLIHAILLSFAHLIPSLSLAHLIHSFGHLPVLFTHTLLATCPRYSTLFSLCSFNSIFKKSRQFSDQEKFRGHIPRCLTKWPINILKSAIMKLIPNIFHISQPEFKTKVISKQI